jgi:hypothetical protein
MSIYNYLHTADSYSNDKYKYLAAGVYLSEDPSPTWFLFGVVKQFCRYGMEYPCTHSHRKGGGGR